MTTNKLKEITVDGMAKTFPFCYEVVGGFPFLIQEAYIEQSFSPNCLLKDDEEDDIISKSQDLNHQNLCKMEAPCFSYGEYQTFVPLKI